jgi:hypothetical protein
MRESSHFRGLTWWMHSALVVEPESATPDESLGRAPAEGFRIGRTGVEPDYHILRAGRSVAQKTDEVVVRDLRRSTAELQRDTLRIALVGFEPTTSGVQGMYSEPAVGLFFHRPGDEVVVKRIALSN